MDRHNEWCTTTHSIISWRLLWTLNRDRGIAQHKYWHLPGPWQIVEFFAKRIKSIPKLWNQFGISDNWVLRLLVINLPASFGLFCDVCQYLEFLQKIPILPSLHALLLIGVGCYQHAHFPSFRSLPRWHPIILARPTFAQLACLFKLSSHRTHHILAGITGLIKLFELSAHQTPPERDSWRERSVNWMK